MSTSLTGSRVRESFLSDGINGLILFAPSRYPGPQLVIYNNDLRKGLRPTTGEQRLSSRQSRFCCSAVCSSPKLPRQPSLVVSSRRKVRLALSASASSKVIRDSYRE